METKESSSASQGPNLSEVMDGINWLKKNAATKAELRDVEANIRKDMATKGDIAKLNKKIDDVIEGSGWIMENMATKNELENFNHKVGEKIDKFSRKLEIQQSSLDNHDRRIEKVELKLGLGAV